MAVPGVLLETLGCCGVQPPFQVVAKDPRHLLASRFLAAVDHPLLLGSTLAEIAAALALKLDAMVACFASYDNRKEVPPAWHERATG